MKQDHSSNLWLIAFVLVLTVSISSLFYFGMLHTLLINIYHDILDSGRQAENYFSSICK